MQVRSTFSPIFTSGKMKMMLRFMNATTKLFESEIAKSVEVSKKNYPE